jgi:hypothetical protein
MSDRINLLKRDEVKIVLVEKSRFKILLFYLGLHSYGRHGSDTILSHLILRSKPDAHRMYAQDQVVIHVAKM